MDRSYRRRVDIDRMPKINFDPRQYRPRCGPGGRELDIHGNITHARNREMAIYDAIEYGNRPC